MRTHVFLSVNSVNNCVSTLIELLRQTTHLNNDCVLISCLDFYRVTI